MFLAVQCFYLTRTNVTKKIYIAGLFYFGAAFALSLLLIILFAIATHATGLGWSLFMAVIIVFDLFVLLRRYGTYKKQHENKDVRDNHKVRGKKLKALIIINYVFAVLSLIFLSLLVNGAYTGAYGIFNYPPRGKFMTVTLSDGEPQTIHYICNGPLNSSYNTFWFEVGGGHVAADFYGIQKLLTESNVRSCIYDRPGMGWSSLAHKTNPFWYKEMLDASGEKGPFVLCGWAAGGLIMLNATIQYPDLVSALVLMDASSSTEAEAYAFSRQVSAEVAEQWYRGEIASRYSLFDVIRGIGTPAGLMQYFLPRNPQDYFPQDLYDEFYWFSLQENFWMTQFFALQDLVNNPRSFDEDKFPRHVPIGILMSHSNVTQKCVDNNYPINSTNCIILQREEEFYNAARLQYVNRTDNATVIVCEDCDLGFPVKKPHFVVNALVEMFGIETGRTDP
jgi:pimeloyl-ACP methyl ester carboxylesterase